eukprot:1157230-Pelagomonas_calceolata.AAC.6
MEAEHDHVEPPVYVPADLSSMDLGIALASTGFDASVPTLFTVEGLIYYLPPAAARKLMKRIMQLSAPGSKVCFGTHVRAIASQMHLSSVLGLLRRDLLPSSLHFANRQSYTGARFVNHTKSAWRSYKNVWPDLLSHEPVQVVFDFMHAAALEGKSASPLGYKYAGFKTTAKSVASKGEAYKFGLQDSAAGVSSFLRAASKDANAEGTAGELRLNTVSCIAAEEHTQGCD